METRIFLQQMNVLETLKNATRHSWTSSGRHESVAEHSWRMTMMAYFMKDEFPETDIDKVIRMCMIHDLGEIFTGDIPAFDKTEGDEQRESRLLADWVRSLPEPFAGEMAALFAEMEEQKTAEAKLYKAIDKLEAVVQHNEADLSTWIPLEYSLNRTYGTEQTEFSPYLRALRAEMRRDTDEKLRKAGIG